MKNIVKNFCLLSALIVVEVHVFAQAKIDTIPLDKGLIKEVKYHENGNLFNVAFYDLNEEPIKVGNELEYYHDGTTIKKNLNRLAGKYDGKQEVFYEDGKLKSTVIYKNNQIVDSASWDTAGNTIPFLGFIRRAKPAIDLNEYVKKNLKYPKEAIKQNIQGIVRINFTIESNGTLSNIKSDGKAVPYLTDEAIRVMSNSDNWHPAMYEGFVVKSQFIFPINFVYDTGNSLKSSKQSDTTIKSFKIK